MCRSRAPSRRKTLEVSARDLSALSEPLRIAAVFTNQGREVMWPREVVRDAVNALADAGRTVLGLDLRSDGEGTTPEGAATEVPWSEFQPGLGDQVEEARKQALDALNRLEVATDLGVYRWVLVTW